MTDFEERFRRALWDITDQAPTVADRRAVLHRRIARRRRIRVAGIAGAVVVVLAGTSAGLVTLGPSAHHVPVAVAVTPTPSHADLTGPKNILLVGEDPVGTNDQGAADSIMILHLTGDHRSGYLISIPRDAYVRIPAYDNGATSYPGGQDRIGAAFGYGARGLTGAAARAHGFALLSKTVQTLSGITVDAAAVADLAGFEQVIDAIGGIDLYVDERTTSVDLGHDKSGKQAVPFSSNSDGVIVAPVPGVSPVVYEVGTRHLTGAQAMDYIRQRQLLANADGDYGRQRHQAQLLMAVYRQVFNAGTLSDPQRLAGLLSTVGKALTLDPGTGSVTDWLVGVRDLPANGLVGVKMNGGHYDVIGSKVGSVEDLNATSRQLLDAVRADSVGRFVAAHPDWVITSR